MYAILKVNADKTLSMVSQTSSKKHAIHEFETLKKLFPSETWLFNEIA